MPYNTDPQLLAAIRKYGGDTEMQAALLATTWVESGGNPYGAGGDGGRSWGAYQEYDLGRGAGLSKQQRQDPVGSTQRAYKEFSTYAAKGLKGGALAAAAQRPANAAAYSQKVQALIGEARRALGGSAVNNSSWEDVNPQNRPDLTGGGTAAAQGFGDAFAQNYAVGRQRGEGLSSIVMKSLLASVGQPAVSEASGVKANPTGNGPLGVGGSGAVDAARRNLGTPYSWGGGTPSGPTKGFGRGANTVGFDCSSLVQNAWAKMGVKIPRTTYEQIKVGQAINPSNMASWKPGDLIFPHSGHVQMYIGNGQVIHAPRTGGVVEIVPVGKAMAVRRPG